MPYYMTQFAYTAQAWAALTSNPTDRSVAVSALAEKLGCRMVSLYYHFGEYDGVLFFDAPDDITANALVLAVASPGHLKATRTTRLMAPSEAVAAMRKAHGAGYEAPKP